MTEQRFPPRHLLVLVDGVLLPVDVVATLVVAEDHVDVTVTNLNHTLTWEESGR